VDKDSLILKMVSKGACRADIQERTGLSKSGVRKALARLGVVAAYGGNGPKPKQVTA
jgi:hypothetical protein